MKALVRIATLFLSLSVYACAPDSGADQASEPAAAIAEGLAKATFAGGCFWCMEPPFDELDGVVSTTSGYIDGQVKNPTWTASVWPVPPDDTWR